MSAAMSQDTEGSGGEEVLPDPATAPVDDTLASLAEMFSYPYATAITPEGKRGYRLITGAGDIVLLKKVPYQLGMMRQLKDVKALNMMIQDEERIVPTDMRVGLRTILLTPCNIRLFAYNGQVIIRIGRRNLGIQVIGLHRPRVYDAAIACGSGTILDITDADGCQGVGMHC